MTLLANFRGTMPCSHFPPWKYVELHLPNMIFGGVQEKLPDVPRGFRKNYLWGEGNDLKILNFINFSEGVMETGVPTVIIKGKRPYQ